MTRSSNAQIAARLEVRKRMEDVENIAVAVAEAAAAAAELRTRMAVVDALRVSLLAGLGHFAGAETASNLTGTALRDVRAAMRLHDPSETGASMDAWEAFVRPARRKGAPLAPPPPPSVDPTGFVAGGAS